MNSQSLKDSISYQEGAVVSREILKTPGTTVTLFAFAENQGLSEHSTPFEALVQILEGQAEITIDHEPHILKEGEIIIMPANHPHAVRGMKPFKMMLTMAR